jgi:hypothetical protein
VAVGLKQCGHAMPDGGGLVAKDLAGGVVASSHTSVLSSGANGDATAEVLVESLIAPLQGNLLSPPSLSTLLAASHILPVMEGGR